MNRKIKEDESYPYTATKRHMPEDLEKLRRDQIRRRSFSLHLYHTVAITQFTAHLISRICYSSLNSLISFSIVSNFNMFTLYSSCSSPFFSSNVLSNSLLACLCTLSLPNTYSLVVFLTYFLLHYNLILLHYLFQFSYYHSHQIQHH